MDAVMTRGNVPLALAVPLRVPVPFPASVNEIPGGKIPVTLKLEVGVPVVVTVKMPLFPFTKVALLALVIAGA